MKESFSTEIIYAIKCFIILTPILIGTILSFLFWTIFSPIIILWKWALTDKSYLEVAKDYFKEIFGTK